jgi:Nif-specific regulatory protein
VRQLENTIERAVIMGDSGIIGINDLPQDITEFKKDSIRVGASLKEAQDAFKRDFIRKSLAFCKGNKTKSSKMLGIQRTYLSRLIKELDV